jgi:hypothetical protein
MRYTSDGSAYGALKLSTGEVYSMRRRTVELLVFALVATFMTTSSAQAYYYLPGGCSQPHTYGGTAVASVKFRSQDLTGYATLSPNSAGRWNNALTTVRFVAASSGYAVYASESNFGNVDFAGVTYIDCGSDGSFVPITQSWGNTYYLATMGSGGRYNTMVHELGHALGLAHNSEHSNCSTVQIMYPSNDSYLNCGIEYPKSDDIAGANSLY